MYYVYVLKRDKKPYIGYTNNLARRFKQHTLKHACTLLYYEAYLSEIMARKREQNLKQYGSAWHGLKRRLAEEGAGSLFSNPRSTRQENI